MSKPLEIDEEGLDIALNLGLDPNLPGVREEYRALMPMIASCEIESVEELRQRILDSIERDNLPTS